MNEYIYNIILNEEVFLAKFWTTTEEEALEELNECLKTDDILRHIVKTL